MDIKKQEFKKIICSPIFIVLTIMFLLYNLFLILDKSYIKEELKVLNEIVDSVGYEINDEMMVEFKDYYEENLNKANSIIAKQTSNKYESISKFFEEDSSVNTGGELIYSKEEIDFLNKVSNIEFYYKSIEGLDESYEGINISNMSKTDIEESTYSEKVTNMIKGNWDDFEIRFNELKENGEHRNLFFFGRAYKMHSFLFKNLFVTMIYEIMILIVLITGFIVNYEFENKTALLVYSTKRGRHIIKDKLIVALGSTLLVTTIIFTFTLAVYFMVFDYSGLWGVPISTYFGQEYAMPYMSWWNISILQYLILAISTVYIIEAIFFGLAFSIAKVMKNTYIVAGIFAVLVGIGIALTTWIPASWSLVVTTVFTPFTLILNPSWWFMQRGGLQSFKYYEHITLAVWAIVVSLIVFKCINSFRKENIN